MNLAMDGKKLVIMLHVPAHDLLGFEHTPSTKKQIKSLNKTLKVLSKSKLIFKTSKKAGCSLEKSPEIKTNLRAGKDHHDHEHGHEHEHHHDKDEQHSDFDIKYIFSCKSIKKLKDVQALIFKKFNRMQKIRVQAITTDKQLILGK